MTTRELDFSLDLSWRPGEPPRLSLQPATLAPEGTRRPQQPPSGDGEERGEERRKGAVPGSRARIWCVQVREPAGPFDVFPPVYVHPEDSHPGWGCSGFGHQGGGLARHVIARSALGALVHALGLTYNTGWRWLRRGWALEGPAPETPPEATAFFPSPWLATAEESPEETPGGQEWLARHEPAPEKGQLPVVLWCVLYRPRPRFSEGRGPWRYLAGPARVQALQDGLACPTPGHGEEHRHVWARAPRAAVARALGLSGDRSRSWKREVWLRLAGPTARRFASSWARAEESERGRRRRGRASSSPPAQAEAREEGQSAGPSVNLSLRLHVS